MSTSHSDWEGPSLARVPLRTVQRPTFMGAPLVEDISKLDAQVALLGVPYDYGTQTPSSGQGLNRSSRGPQALRASRVYRYFDSITGEAAVGRYEVQEDTEYLKGVTMADCGDVNLVPGGDVIENFRRITAVVDEIAARGSLVAAIGGDHSVSFPVGRGMERHGPFDVVMFDAHADFADEFNGSKLSHASNLRRLSELPFVERIVMVGLRVVTKRDHQDALEHGCKIVTSRQLIERGASAVIDAVVRPGRNLYVSIDLDVLDASLVPDVGWPEPDGIPYRLLQEALRAVSAKGNVVGFDLCELASASDAFGTTARVASWTLTHFLGSITANRAR